MKESRQYPSLMAWFTYHPVAANLFMLAIIFAGGLSLLTMERSLNPDIEPNNIDINVFYPGAAPQEVERSVTVKIEERIKGMDGIERFTSISDDSWSNISIEVINGYDVAEVLDKVQAKVDAIRTFPREVEKPLISRQTIRRRAIMLQIYGDMGELDMKTLADSIKEELIQFEGLSSIDVLGVKPYEISVEIPEEVLRKHELSLAQVVKAIQSSSIDIPGGSIKTETGDLLLRAKGQAYNQYDFERIVLKTFTDSSELRLGDIAKIKDGFADVDGYARFNGKPSVGLAIYAAGDQDLLEVAERVRNYAEKKRDKLPENVSLVTWADVSYYLQGRIDMMYSNLIMGAILVFLSLILFLDLKTSFWTMVSLPVCFLGTFALMPLVDVTLNMASMFGMLLVIGILVDDAIVIGESVHSETYEYGNSVENVLKGADRVAVTATFGLLTTLAAFVPPLLVTGPYAALSQSIGYVVVFALIVSLIESRLILPAHLAHVEWKERPWMKKIEDMQEWFNDWLSEFMETKYRPFIVWALDNRYIVMASFVAMLFLSWGLVAVGAVRVSPIPDIHSDFVIANLEMRDGASDQQMRDALELIERSIIDIEQEYIKESGEEQGLAEHRLLLSDAGKFGWVMLELVKDSSGDVGSNEVVEKWRDRVGEIAGAKSLNFATVEDVGGLPVAFKIIGDNMEQLEAAANMLEKKLRDYAGVFDIRNGSTDINDEVHIAIKPGAADLGLSLFDLGTQVRQAFYGAEAQRVQRGSDEVKVMVRLPEHERQSLMNLENLYIQAPNGTVVPFNTVADMTIERGLARHTRVNGDKAISVGARVDKMKMQPSRISDHVLKFVAPQIESAYPGVRILLDGQSEQETAVMKKFLYGFLVALAAIYVLLAIPLHSYLQPLIIMAVIPFGIIGAILGHMLMGLAFSMLSFFGVIALAGVVVIHSLLMVDFVNEEVKKGRRLESAAVESGIKRFRHILATSLTTVAGLIPMMFETSLQAQLVIPMAVSVGYGALFATLITLVLIPCMYLILDDIKQRGRAGMVRVSRV